MRISRFTSDRPQSRRRYRVVATLFLTFSVISSGLYSWFVWDQATNGIERIAVVVSVEDDEALTSLIVYFTTVDGQPVITEFREYSGDHRVADVVRIRYVPRNPSIARQADEPVAHWLFIVGSGWFLVVGIAMFVHAWRFASDPVVWPPWRRRSA